ncbi:MAG: hypothetical protein Kow0089_21300 [Desulfobulbaceae bacterium]
MALVLTLMAVSFLVAVTVQLAASVNWQMQGAAAIRDSVQLDGVCRSGLSLARAALFADFKENTFDSEHDVWNKVGAGGGSSLLGAGNMELAVTDLSGLLQVNALVPEEKDAKKFEELQKKQIELWKRLLNSGGFAIDDPDEVDRLIDALIDWIDEDDRERDKGAESGFYLSLSPSYSARNGPVTYPEELLLIRGMTKELFYGNEDHPGLVKYLTVAGRDGKININAAPREILMILDQNMTAENAEELTAFRGDEDNRGVLADAQWYKQVSGALDLPKDLITVQSAYFLVSVTGKQNGMQRTGTGIIVRDNKKGGQQLLYWEVR